MCVISFCDNNSDSDYIYACNLYHKSETHLFLIDFSQWLLIAITVFLNIYNTNRCVLQVNYLHQLQQFDDYPTHLIP